MNSTTQPRPNKPDPVQYIVRFPNAHQHLAHIETIFQIADSQTVLEISMPVWTPGSYLVREYARHIEAIQVTGEKQGIRVDLIARKLDKHSWAVNCEGCELVRVSYQLYCREQTVRTNWVEEEYGFITGAAAFISSKTHVNHPCLLTIEPQPNWPDIACSLPRAQNIPTNSPLHHCFQRSARCFDELVDSPFLMGTLAIRKFEVGGKEHFLACYGTDGTWNLDRAVQDCSAIIAAEHRFWKVIPYESYWFINIAIEGYGGLEHDDNTVLITSRWAMKRRESYVEWLGLVSHEFFHTWNIRRLRPKTLMQYDYSNEQYFPELWIAEGITSYFDDLLVFRAGLTTEQEYIAQLNKAINTVEDTPGKTIQSLYDASFDTWIKHYRPDENTPNSRISYYVHGSIVAFLLDIHLRKVTENKFGLDHVMRTLWERHQSTGYTLEDFENIATHLAGRSLDAWFKRHVYSTGNLCYEEAFEYLGLIRQTNSPAPLTSTTIFGATFDSSVSGNASEADLGIDTAIRDGRIVVTRVLRSGVASQSGLMVDDELIAAGGFRLPKDNWKDRISGLPAGHSIEFTIARRGRLKTLPITIAHKRSMTLSVLNPCSPEQQERRRRWMAGEFS